MLGENVLKKIKLTWINCLAEQTYQAMKEDYKIQTFNNRAFTIWSIQ